MNPDRIVRLLNSYFSSMTACVIERKGTLDKFIGDALEADWKKALDAYFKGDFVRAMDLFGRLRTCASFGVACGLFMERCEFLMENPPQEWAGVWTYDTN